LEEGLLEGIKLGFEEGSRLSEGIKLGFEDG
jgi:hypothetical protein